MVTLSFDVENVKLRYAAFVSFPLIDPSGKKRFQTKGELQSSGHSQNELVLSEILHIANIKFTDIAVSGAVLQGVAECNNAFFYHLCELHCSERIVELFLINFKLLS